MNTVAGVKQRIANLVDQNRRLASELAASQRQLAHVRRERDDLRREVGHSDQEVRVVQEELLEDRRRCEELLEQRAAIIAELDLERGQLAAELEETQAELARALARMESYAERLRATAQERDAALGELHEASSAFVDIRDRLQISLDEVADPATAQAAQVQ